ncbi:hypothetical protein [Alteromonas sp. ASW11-130]|nr:hypothetical protein [Alteromonas sp. ASW11-130]MCW8092964.1 hypothetical protein [Alteromonas sp. ASW11-130]
MFLLTIDGNGIGMDKSQKENVPGPLESVILQAGEVRVVYYMI